MKTTHPALSSHQDALADQFAHRITRHLDDACDELPYDISERLRAARVQALAQRKREVQATQHAPAVLSSGSNTLVFGKGGHERSGWWNALVSAVPLIALVAGLVLIDIVQEESVLSEVVEIDAALLTDDLPPAAYADPGFVQFLKTSADTAD